MNGDRQIWLGRDGEEFGPYPESQVRQWAASGQVPQATLAWCEGMPTWRPLGEVLGGEPTGDAPARPPMPPGPPELTRPVDPVRARLPEPPSLHWFLLLVLCLVTAGLFAIVWPFVQASWVKKIDPESKATTWLVAALVCLGGSWLFAFGTGVMVGFSEEADLFASMPVLVAGYAVGLLQYAFLLTAFFGMSASMRKVLPRYGLAPRIGHVTLFFFTVFYLQGQLTWISRWRDTGQTEPPPPKAVFWILWCIPVLLGSLLVFVAFAALHRPGAWG